ncbi:MAG: hypothetical protein Q4C96_06945, partial [Planctomycetia bacterium]|nr:hypothetical protein [Planctomycetia bacterium]
MKTFQCTKCGFSLQQPTEPFRCPQCGSQGIGLFRLMQQQGYGQQNYGGMSPQNPAFSGQQQPHYGGAPQQPGFSGGPQRPNFGGNP